MPFIVNGDKQSSGPSENQAELLASQTNRRCVNQRQHLFDVFLHKAIEQLFVAILNCFNFFYLSHDSLAMKVLTSKPIRKMYLFKSLSSRSRHSLQCSTCSCWVFTLGGRSPWIPKAWRSSKENAIPCKKNKKHVLSGLKAENCLLHLCLS